MKQTILVTIAAAALLLAVSAGLSGIREVNARQEREAMLRTLLPGSAEFSEEAVSDPDSGIRAAYRGETGWVLNPVVPGYAGEISMLVGVSTAGQVTGLVVRDLQETPGLGRKALTEEVFLAQFLNTDGTAAVGENIDALTGATVTSKAIARGVNSAVGYVTGTDTVSGATVWGG